MSATHPHRDPATATAAQILGRIQELVSWPRDMNDALNNDPRCGCGDDVEDGMLVDRCDWDDLRTLEHALSEKKELAA